MSTTFSIRPLVLVDGNVEDAVGDTIPQFWGLYHRDEEGLLHWISDHPTESEALWGKSVKEGAAPTDSERLDWLEKNYLNGMGSPRLQFSPPKPGWHVTLATRFPNGFWHKHWQTRDAQNQFSNLRQAIDAVMTELKTSSR